MHLLGARQRAQVCCGSQVGLDLLDGNDENLTNRLLLLDFVNKNTDYFKDAYFDIAAVRIYKQA
jgi:hypothetical protein